MRILLQICHEFWMSLEVNVLKGHTCNKWDANVASEIVLVIPLPMQPVNRLQIGKGLSLCLACGMSLQQPIHRFAAHLLFDFWANTAPTPSAGQVLPPAGGEATITQPHHLHHPMLCTGRAGGKIQDPR